MVDNLQTPGHEENHQRDFLRQRDVQIPDHGHGEDQHGVVGEGFREGYPFVESELVNAVTAGDVFVPSVGNGGALEGSYEDGAEVVSNDYEHDDVDGVVEGFGDEDVEVEE